MVSNGSGNRNHNRQYLGVDRRQAIQAAEAEAGQLKQEVSQLKAAEDSLQSQLHSTKRQWNGTNLTIRRLTSTIQTQTDSLNNTKEHLLELQSDDLELDTSDLDADVQQAEAFLGSCQEKARVLEQAIADKAPEVEGVRQQCDEVAVRNQRVAKDIEVQEQVLYGYERDKGGKCAQLEKLRQKCGRLEQALGEQGRLVVDLQDKASEALRLAKEQQWKYEVRQSENGVEEGVEVDDDVLERVEVRQVEREPEYYKAKRERQNKRLQSELRKRQMTNESFCPEEIRGKYERAANDLNTKMNFVTKIEDNITEIGRAHV